MSHSVLLLEDDSKLRELLVGELEDSGYEVDETENGLQAIEFLTSKNYDAIVLDIKVPKINGIQILNYVVADERNCNALRYVHTGYLDETTLHSRLKTFNIQKFFMKPYDIGDLISDLDNELGKYEDSRNHWSDNHTILCDIAHESLKVFGIEIKREPWFTKRNLHLDNMHYTRMPIFGGDVYGTFSLGVPSNLILQQAKKIFPEDQLIFNSTVAQDIMGEMCNQIGGAFKTELIKRKIHDQNRSPHQT